MRRACSKGIDKMEAKQLMKKPVVLIGFMGSGKSSIGKQVALLCGREFIDLDQRIVQELGISIPQIFAEKGEPYFRQLERSILQQSLEQADAIIATGGGVVLQEANRLLLQQSGWVFNLITSPASIFERLGKDRSRPLLLDEAGQVSYERVETLWRERQPYYSWAPWQIMNEGRSKEDVVWEIVQLIRMNVVFDSSTREEGQV